MGPLKGVRILDLSMVVRGLLHDDAWRHGGGRDQDRAARGRYHVRNIGGADRRGGMSVGDLNWNRNKRAMVLDLKRPARAEVFLRMAEKADAVVQNVRPGVVDRLGVGYEAVAARNPEDRLLLDCRLWIQRTVMRVSPPTIP